MDEYCAAEYFYTETASLLTLRQAVGETPCFDGASTRKISFFGPSKASPNQGKTNQVFEKHNDSITNTTGMALSLPGPLRGSTQVHELSMS